MDFMGTDSLPAILTQSLYQKLQNTGQETSSSPETSKLATNPEQWKPQSLHILVDTWLNQQATVEKRRSHKS
jgi:hypothetical protein